MTQVLADAEADHAADQLSRRTSAKFPRLRGDLVPLDPELIFEPHDPVVVKYEAGVVDNVSDEHEASSPCAPPHGLHANALEPRAGAPEPSSPPLVVDVDRGRLIRLAAVRIVDGTHPPM